MDQRIRLTKKILKDSIIEILKTKSIDKITIKEVCEYAQINRTTFYKYYSDCYSLLDEIEQDFLNSIRDHLKDYKENTLEMLLELLKNDNGFSKVFLLNNVDKSLAEKIFSIPEISYSFMSTIKQTSININLEKMLLFIYAGAYEVIVDWIRHDFDMSAKELSQMIISFINPLLMSA